MMPSVHNHWRHSCLPNSVQLLETAISAGPIIKVNMLLNNGEKDEIKKDIAKVMQPPG